MATALGFIKSIAWEIDSPFLDVDYEEPNAFGVSTLKHLATKKVLSDQRNIDQSHFRHVPWPIAEELWQYLTRRQEVTSTLYSGKIITDVIVFRHLSQHCDSRIGHPRYSLSGYISLVKSSGDNWATRLNIWTEFARVPELVELADVTNLVSLEVNTSSHLLELPEHEVASLNDRVLRTWGELAKTTGAFKHLQVMRLYQQRELTEQSFRYLSKLPALEYCVLAMCDRMTQESAIKTATSEGWNVLEDDFDQKILQFSGRPASNKRRGRIKWRGDRLDGHLSASLPSDIPILEFSIGQRHERLKDRDVIVMQRKDSHKGNKRSLVETASVENGWGAGKRTKKPAMKERGKDLSGMLADFL